METSSGRQRASDLLPPSLFEGGMRKQFGHGLPRAAVAYAGAIVVYVLCVVFLVIPQLGSADLGEAFYALFGQHFLIATPAVLSCLNIATRWRDHSRDAAAIRLTDLAVTTLAAVAGVLVVGDMLGLLGSFFLPGQSASSLLYDLLLQAAGAVASAAAGVWALAELTTLRAAGVER